MQTKIKMRTKKLIVHLAVFLSFFAANPGYSKSMVWKISKDADQFYLGGTFHLLSESDHPLPEEFMEAYDNADEIIFESDLAGAQSPAFQQKMMGIMTYQDGQTLSSELSNSTYQQLKDFMAERRMPIEQFAPFKPWAVTLILTVQEYTALGMLPEFGVESVLERRARKDGKEVQSLETTDQQISFLASLENVEPNKSIQYFIRDIEKIPEAISDLKNGWRAGNLAEIENNALTVQMRDEYPEIYETLIVKRNNDWMKTLTSLFDDDAIEVVFVGAMHLTSKDGLLNQLEQRGFTITQLD